jgi:hypothetical protein
MGRQKNIMNGLRKADSDAGAHGAVGEGSVGRRPDKNPFRKRP